MLQRLFDFCGDLGQYLPASSRTMTIAGAAIIVLLLILLAIRIRKRKKGSRKKTAETAETQDAGLSASPEPELSEEKSAAAEEEAPPADVIPEPEPELKPEPEPEPPAPERAGLMDRLKSGLGKTRKSLTNRLENVFSEKGQIDDETIEEIEEALITADVGIETTTALIGKISENASRISNTNELKAFLKEEILKVFEVRAPQDKDTAKPRVVMVVGVNGVGKTTTIGKMAFKYRAQGESVLLGAADTFRAAAVEQLDIWAQRADAQMVKHRENADPAAVAYDAVEAAVSRNTDRVIIDTAGRLHTKTNLMEQLKKIKRSIDKKMPGAPHEVLLVLDATTGQNAVSQARLFQEGIGVNGLILTKLDGTAKGGIVVGICNTMKLPIRYIGVGETIEDLQPFDPKRFVEALF